MEAIANTLFEHFLLLLEPKVSLPISGHFGIFIFTIPVVMPTFQPTGKETDHELISYAQLLIFKFNHIFSRIKKVTDHFLSLLVDK